MKLCVKCCGRKNGEPLGHVMREYGTLTEHLKHLQLTDAIQRCENRKATNDVSHLIRETRTSRESIVVLDRYTEVTTKVHIQRRRNLCQILDILVHKNTFLDVSAKIFLSNPANKQCFIVVSDEKINAKPTLTWTAIKCLGYADRSIVETTLEALKLHKPVIIKSDHTDVLVMCLAATDTRGLFLKTRPNLYNIEEFQSKIEPSQIRDNLLMLHRFFGSDCTLAFFGHP